MASAAATNDLPAVWHLAPAWLLSLVVHLIAAVVACLLFRPAPPKGIGTEEVRPAAIV